MYFDCCGYWDVAGLSIFLGALLVTGIIYLRWKLKQRAERAYEEWQVEVAQYNMVLAQKEHYLNWCQTHSGAIGNPDETEVYDEPEFYLDDYWGV